MKTNRKKLLTLSLAAALCLSLAACGSASETEPGAEDTAGESAVNLSYGVSQPWDSLMPYGSTSDSSRILWDKIYDRLAYVHPDGACDPRAAERWESTDRGYGCLFHLNPDCAFHDGTPVTAQSWVETIQLLTSPDCGGSSLPFSALAGTDDSGKAVPGETLGAEALDDTTLKLTFRYPTAPEEFLAEWNRDFYVLPTHLLKDIPANQLLTDDFWTAPIGSGPCRYASELEGSSMVLDANGDYQLGVPGFDSMTVTVMEGEALLPALLSGELDYYAFGNSISETERASAEDGGLAILKDEAPSAFCVLMLNNERLSDSTLRQAVNLALEKELLCQQSTGSLGTVTGSSILPGTPYAGAMIEGTYDPVQAAELVSQSSYNGETLTLAAADSSASLAALVRQELADAGINVEVETVDAASLSSVIREGACDMALSSHVPANVPLWFTGSRFSEGSNPFRIAQLTPYEEQISAIRQETNQKDRIALVDEFEQLLSQEMPFVPLWFSHSLHAVSATVEGIDYPAAFCNENVWDWTVSR